MVTLLRTFCFLVFDDGHFLKCDLVGIVFTECFANAISGGKSSGLKPLVNLEGGVLKSSFRLLLTSPPPKKFDNFWKK